MKEDKIEIGRSKNKQEIRHAIINFLENHDYTDWSFVEINYKEGEIVRGLIFGQKYSIRVKTFQNKTRRINFEEINSVELLSSLEVYQVISSLIKQNNQLSAKRLKEATLKLKELIQVAKNK